MKITEPSGRRQPGRGKARRIAGSLAVGAVVAAGLVAWEGLHNHAALAASAAGPQPKGVHQTVGSILATGGIFTFLVITALVFAVTTVLARRRKARSATPLYPPVARPGRGRASARW